MNATKKSKTVWITGASSGLGKALALAYAQRDCNLILSSRKKETLAEVKALCADPSKVEIVVLNLADHENIPAIVSSVVKSHDIDLLINNGGISQRSLAKDTDLSVYKKLMDINYLGTVALTQALLPHLINQKAAQIAVMSSVAGKFGVPLRSGYSASKFALHGYFEALRAELKDSTVKITMICPGFINTEISKNALTADGSPQNTMDQAQANGMSAQVFAQIAIKAISNKRAEVNIGGFKETKMAVWVSRIFPSLFRKIIAKSQVT